MKTLNKQINMINKESYEYLSKINSFIG
jgi:hypothetical protein